MFLTGVTFMFTPCANALAIVTTANSKGLDVVGVVSFLLVFMFDAEESEGIEIVQGKADVSGVKT